MSRNADVTDYCSVTLETREREPTNATPLERYDQRGYVGGDDDDAKALDAAAALTASRWGPPFDTAYGDADDEWWHAGYECACRTVEAAIVDALVARAGGDGA